MLHFIGRWILFLSLISILPFCSSADGAESSVRYADLGTFQLDNGSVIQNCRIAYLTAGTLNADRSNAVLVPTWLAGTSQEMLNIGYVGPGKVFDSSRFYIIAVDSFGNGLSASPSNSPGQPDQSFPRFSIRDMVRAQYLLLTAYLNIRHVRAVAGISMGALQTFQWMVSYPGFMDKAVPIQGNPWMTSPEKLLWSAHLEILENVGECKGSSAAMRAVAPLFVLHAWPPEYRAAKTSPAAFPAFLAEEQKKLSRYNATNWARQVGAIMHHDILKNFGGSPQKAAAVVRADCLIVTSAQDQIVWNEKTKAFARLISAQTAELDGSCGHFAFICDRENLKKIVNDFLVQQPPLSSKAVEPSGK